MIDFWMLCRLRHRIIVGVQHPAGLLREIHPRGAENVDELVFVAADRFRRVDRRRRDDGDRGRTAQFVIVGAPEVLVNRPRPAQMVDELTAMSEEELRVFADLVMAEVAQYATKSKIALPRRFRR